jgi:plasmid stabilization system protein ParE
VRFEFTAAAELELDEAVEYYNQQRAGLGEEFVAEVRRAVEQVLEYPHAWQLLDERDGIRRCRLNRFPYGLVYTIQGDIALALAVMYVRRKPAYWRERLRGQ